MPRGPYAPKVIRERRGKDTGCVRRRHNSRQEYEAVTPKWAGGKVIGEPQNFKFRAERLLEKWLEENPRPVEPAET